MSADGGGSKLNIIVINRNMELLGCGHSGGVNINSATEADCHANIETCLQQVFSGYRPDSIDVLYAVIVGSMDTFLQAVSRQVEVKKIIKLNEISAGLMAGALWSEGFLALSGTGSFVKFMYDGSTNFGRLNMNRVGGWGPIFSDDGSGSWIGCQAARAALAGFEGWGEPTVLMDLIQHEWGLADPGEMVQAVYNNPAPYRKIATLTVAVSNAVYLGDSVAIRIVREAGELLAKQAICLIRRHDVPKRLRRLVLGGGAWKTHPLMYETFSDVLLSAVPDFDLRKPIFEPVVAGPAFFLLEGGATENETENILRAKLPGFIIS